MIRWWSTHYMMLAYREEWCGCPVGDDLNQSVIQWTNWFFMGVIWCYTVQVSAVSYTPPHIPSQSEGVHVDSTQKLHSAEIEPGLSAVEPIAPTRCMLYHSTIVACCTWLTCAIYVTCCSIGKLIYFYSIWDIWCMSWISFSVWIQWRCPFWDQTNYIW